MGFDTHAHMQLDTTMAESPERAMRLMRTVWDAATRKFRDEVSALQELADQRGDGITIG